MIPNRSNKKRPNCIKTLTLLLKKVPKKLAGKITHQLGATKAELVEHLILLNTATTLSKTSTIRERVLTAREEERIREVIEIM